MGWKYARPITEKLMTLEEPGKPLAFDADRRLIDEVTAQYDLKALVEGLKGKSKEEARATLGEFGRRLMELTIELVDGKYIDRTGEVVEKVAQRTGVSFPHRFERYAELAILASRPTDRWNIAKATTKNLVLQVSGCALSAATAEAGLSPPCEAMCFGSFEAAAARTGDRLNMDRVKALPGDGMCEFVFSLQT
jgi:hypothetical protein